ncbi:MULTISPECIES: XdhC family protein [unclassified Rhizobium]|uniref:XdhC family protein n=1 Tax=unclassified Rhizobium TaxID=2613769 RepID=UPI000BD12C27|nr:MULTISPECIES: XdhC family protein [unclassified Rhizobium]MDH7808421.1 xanthine dehydrogenase accessory factor [Rhizobium sp. AN67]SOD52362.1 xanthine dehydrogenase accessory factor [Rhizobium sp. AN6A]
MLHDDIAALTDICPQEDIQAATKPTPVRSLLTDDTKEIFGFAIRELAKGRVALATLVEIRGGAARALGSHVAVAADGRFCGYVSGGCIEAAVASEALDAIGENRDREVKFGLGSPFFDIALPCGGGITVSIHVLQNTEMLSGVLEQLYQRRTTGLCYARDTQQLEIVEPPSRAGYADDRFFTVYRPRTRVVISGQSIEAERVADIAQSSGYEVVACTASEKVVPDIDQYTAIVLLHHDLDAEQVVLQAALRSPAFYVGALGSTRTHRRRVDFLVSSGFSRADTDRIRAPIGLFGPTRDANSLALSILADIAASRLSLYA